MAADPWFPTGAHKAKSGPVWDKRDPYYADVVRRAAVARDQLDRAGHLLDRLIETTPDAIGAYPDHQGFAQRSRDVDRHLDALVKDVQEIMAEAYFARRARKQRSA